MPVTDDGQADLEPARAIVGEEGFVAAGWVTVNAFNRISILGTHPVRSCGVDGKILP